MEADSAMRFVDLPFDLIQRICRRLGPVDVCELSLTCKAFRFVSQTKEVWYGMARAHLMQNDRRLSEGVDASVHENETGVQYYNRLHRESRIQYANELTVTWADDP
ncbi:hypothetical protein SARC_02336 [Sphaeroforma arctica JP610]|uniref:F-box domain-containing protein n=1 Tax=Sphaeroforma arctica JP610 TaxID=667725 RepID=A0A0L0G9A5_9EUKA|nr:hypothetical protein SARC_02336 [Sphaeroforma arctica JP610]KNC85499.1 hypothetical protein SARC_02336 [Sphaeroforma arctica JP610]|eukprot:XP_014159401.1 hypothetical protein SARC_02336 [Sphaeroforma arctica JP610]